MEQLGQSMDQLCPILSSVPGTRSPVALSTFSFPSLSPTYFLIFSSKFGALYWFAAFPSGALCAAAGLFLDWCDLWMTQILVIHSSPHAS